jgi:hypothetical protein
MPLSGWRHSVRSCREAVMPKGVHRAPCDDAPMVEVSEDDESVVMRMSQQEAELLSFALRAGYETTSRAEYWIRHGVAQPSVRALQAAVYEVATRKRDSANCALEPGVEAEENPRRPRPTG